MTTTNDTVNERARQIACLIEAMPSDPTASRRLADACLVFGLSHSDRLPLAALALVERVGELDDGAIAEVLSAVDRERERRARR